MELPVRGGVKGQRPITGGLKGGRAPLIQKFWKNIDANPWYNAYNKLSRALVEKYIIQVILYWKAYFLKIFVVNMY